MTPPLATVGYAGVALVTTVASAWLLLPYFVAAPHVLIAPALIVALCVLVASLEGPTRARTRALIERESSLHIATWEYNEAAWSAVMRAAPSPGWGMTLLTAALTTTLVTLIAGMSTEDTRGLLLGASWAIVWSTVLQAYFAQQRAAVASDPRRRLRMTRGILLLGERIYILNPEPALPELGAGTSLIDCVASPRTADANAAGFAGTITWSCSVEGRHNRRRLDHAFPIPVEHAHDVARVVAAYRAIAAANHANPRLALPR